MSFIKGSPIIDDGSAPFIFLTKLIAKPSILILAAQLRTSSFSRYLFIILSSKLKLNITKIGIITNKGYEYSQNGKVAKVKTKGYDHFADN